MRKKKNKNADLDAIIESFKTIEPDCEHFGECGGCYMRQLSYEDQLKAKDEAVKKLFMDVIPEEFDSIYEGITASPVTAGYRNKMEFSFGDMEMGGPLTLGLHKKGSFYDILPVDECQIVDTDFRTILKVTQQFFRDRNITYLHKRTHEGYLRHLLIRKARFTGEILVDLVTVKDCPLGEDFEKTLLEDYTTLLISQKYEGKLCGVLHTKNDSLADTVMDEGTDVLFGESYFYEELLGLRFKITPFSFFQTNSAGAEVLYSKARDFLLSALPGGNLNGKVLYDLYSGTGTIAQLLSPVCEKVVGVEIVEEAVEAAKENAKLNGISNCEFVAGDVLKVIDDMPVKPDCIVLDPPRDGIHPKALPKIINFGVDYILYIACKPKSLARDLPAFMAHGYKPVRMCTVDQFPATQHYETVCLLSNRKADSHIKLSLDMDEYYNIIEKEQAEKK